MKKFSSNIWLVISIGLLTMAILLELSDLGRDWTLFSTRFDRDRFIISLLILFATSMILALCIFRKRTYTGRLKIALALVSLAYCAYSFSNMAIYYFGLNEPYNYFSAKRDLKNGKIQLLFAGQLIGENEKTEQAIDSLDKSYGITYLNVGIETRGLERYNEVIESYLKKQYGKNWKANYTRQVDSIRTANKHLNSWP